MTSWSPMKISPEVSGISPAIRLSVVVLPQPDGPTSATNSPSSTVKRDIVDGGDGPVALVDVPQDHLGQRLAPSA